MYPIFVNSMIHCIKYWVLTYSENIYSHLSISLTAINASALIGNEIAIPHLYKIIKKKDQNRLLSQ